MGTPPPDELRPTGVRLVPLSSRFVRRADTFGSEAGSVPRPSSQASRAIVLLEAATALLATATAAVVGLGGSAASIPCAQFPSCLGTIGTIASAVHVVGAGLLLLLMVGLLFLGRPRPGSDRAVFLLIAVQFGVLLVMASLGAAFASGRLSSRYAPVQFVVLGVFLILSILAIVRSTHPRTPALVPAAPRTGDPAGP